MASAAKRAIKKSAGSESGLAPHRARLFRQSERDLFDEIRRARYDQCDDTCTVDCGHCKGAGRPVE